MLSAILFVVDREVKGQTRAELEEQRAKTLEEIEYVDNLLIATTKEKEESINSIKIIGRKLTLREDVIKGMQDEISLLTERIELNSLAVDMMEEDLIVLKEDYARTIINLYKEKKGNPEIVYILSAKDFNQGYKRLKYLQQVTRFRRRESEIIMELKEHIERSKEKLTADLEGIKDLKGNEEEQKRMLENEQGRKERMVRSLSQREQKLRQELQEKKRIAERIEEEIKRIIEEERLRAMREESTPEQILIGENFEENMGRLPWPVEKGVITSHFGVHKHPVIKSLTENNIGIEITSTGKVSARSVFQGEVVKIFSISGANMTIIVKHGKYLSVYANVVNVRVRQGDRVETRQELGDVYDDPDNNSSVLKFMITLDIEYQDPERWLTKR